MRRALIWVFGILASGIVGALAGQELDYVNGGIAGFLAGAFAFACARLWIGERTSK